MTDDDIKRIHLEQTGFDLDASEAALLDFARAIEQASRRAALEEAAKVCDQMVSVSAVSYETGSACADAIRALSQKTAQGEASAT
jgi:hypothetical protein